MTNILESSTTLEDFTIEKIIGKGSFSSVFLVQRKIDKKLYALKSVFMEKLNKKEQENSVNEVRLLASISHPNVITYKEAFFDEKNNSLNIIMEYAENGDLQSEIIKKKKECEIFDEKTIWLYSIQMIEGLKALHDKKIMHRDLKSANIFLSKNKLQCKLGDMNVSKVIKEKVLRTQTGTPYYASPEVWRDEPYSYKSDLWSIGCVIYEMCQLEPPFNGNDLDELFENVCIGKMKRINNCYSDDLWKMILLLIQVNIEKRVNCDEFLDNDLIKKKIKELKENPDTNYEGYLLEKNKDITRENDILLETIKFKNFKDLKNNLPTFKNYEINHIKRTGNNNNKCNCNQLYKSKSTIINYSFNNIKENENSKMLQIKNISFSKENQNPNCYNMNNNNNLVIKKNKTIKNNIKILQKNASYKGNKNPSYLSIPINIKKEKKLYKGFERIIELNKIKELLKINRKKEKISIKTERGKNKIKKENNYDLLRNQTENNRKLTNLKLIKETNNSLKNKKIKSKINYKHKINLIKRINTEQKLSMNNKIYNLNFTKINQKRIIKSPSYISNINYIEKKQSHSYRIKRNNNIILIKTKLKNLFQKILNDSYLKEIRKNKYRFFHKTPSLKPFLINKKLLSEKANKRNIMTISNNQDYNNYIKKIKKDKKSHLLNKEYNTVNTKSEKSLNNINSKYHYYLNKGNFSSNKRKQNIIKKKNYYFNKNEKLLNVIFTENNSFNNANKVINVCYSNNNIRKINNLYKFDYNSIIVNKASNNKKGIKNNNNKTENNSISNDMKLFKKKITKKQLNNKINDLYIPSSMRHKTLTSSNIFSKSNIDILKKRDNIIYNLNDLTRKKKVKNIKKIPVFHHLYKNKNNLLRYENKFNSLKNILKTDIINLNKERINRSINKNNMNISENNNIIIENNNSFYHNNKPIYLDIKNNNNFKILYKKRLNNINKNKRINTSNSGNNLKNEKTVKSQIFNNYYSINNFDSNLPVKVINFFN